MCPGVRPAPTYPAHVVCWSLSPSLQCGVGMERGAWVSDTSVPRGRDSGAGKERSGPGLAAVTRVGGPEPTSRGHPDFLWAERL